MNHYRLPVACDGNKYCEIVMDSLIVVNNCMSFIRLPNTLSKRERFVFYWIFYFTDSLNSQYEMAYDHFNYLQ